MKDLESMLNIIKGMTKKIAIILILTTVSILLSFSHVKTLAEELPVLAILSLLAGFYIALYTLIYDIIYWLISQLIALYRSVIVSMITLYAKLKSSQERKKNHNLIKKSFVQKVNEEEIEYLSLFFGKPIDAVKNQHGLIPKELMSYFNDLCSNNLMSKKTTANGCGYDFSLDNGFAQALRKRFYSREQISSSLTLNLSDIQANVVITGGGLANGNSRTLN